MPSRRTPSGDIREETGAAACYLAPMTVRGGSLSGWRAALAVLTVWALMLHAALAPLALARLAAADPLATAQFCRPGATAPDTAGGAPALPSAHDHAACAVHCAGSFAGPRAGAHVPGPQFAGLAERAAPFAAARLGVPLAAPPPPSQAPPALA